MAPVVSASSPRLTALNAPARNDAERWNAQSAASSDPGIPNLARFAAFERSRDNLGDRRGEGSRFPQSADGLERVSSSFLRPASAPSSSAPKWRHASTDSRAPCVVRELSPQKRTAAAGSAAKASATGARPDNAKNRRKTFSTRRSVQHSPTAGTQREARYGLCCVHGCHGPTSDRECLVARRPVAETSGG